MCYSDTEVFPTLLYDTEAIAYNTRKVIVTCSLQARANITEVHFLPFNPVDKRTAITYIDSDGKFYRASKGAPEQVQN